jgi:carboxymethylenebutenolidase
MSQPSLTGLWEDHTRYEFSTRDTDATVATMVDEAYVNHIPAMTGGHGKPALHRFYSQDFISLAMRAAVAHVRFPIFPLCTRLR